MSKVVRNEHIRLDTTYRVETPEGVDICQELAGPLFRLYAYLLDGLFRLLVLGLLGFLSVIPGLQGIFGGGVFLILFFLISWFYPIFFEVYRQGQTPGKKIMGLRVLNADLTPVNFGRSMLRNLLRVIDILPAYYIFGLLSILGTRHFQRLGDLAAGTLVVYAPKVEGGWSRHDPNALPTVKPSAPPLTLADEEQMAIIAFTERHQQLSAARLSELAARLARLTQELDAQRAVGRLQAIGLWLLGFR